MNKKGLTGAVKITFYLVLLMFFIGLSYMLIPALAGGNNGAIWTTKNDCGDVSQDINHYNVGDIVFINGADFDPDNYEWEIRGKPGGASCDPNLVVASGIEVVGESRSFCFNAYTVQPDDCGEYQVKFGNKGDNYRVIEIITCADYVTDFTCEEHAECDWCPLCQYPVTPTKVNQWLQGKCVNAGTDCGYHCETGQCGATCDEDTDCSCPIDGCIGPDYYDYPGYGSCVDCPTSCFCNVSAGIGQPCAPTVYYDDPRCGCQNDDDCNDLDKDYCVGTAIKHDEGRCVDHVCQVETTPVQDCYYYEEYCELDDVWYEEGFCNETGPVCDYKTGFVENCNNDYEFCLDNQRWNHDGFCTNGYCDYAENLIEECSGSLEDCQDIYYKHFYGETCQVTDGTTQCLPGSSLVDCRDEYWCNGEEICSELGGVHCEDGTPIDCSGNDFDEIAQCDWVPDGFSYTFDYSPGFASVCDEELDKCTEGSRTFTHTCADADSTDGDPIIPVGNGIRICDAECDYFGTECQNKCIGDIRYFNGDCKSCFCDYDTEDCDKDGCYAYESGCEDRDYYCAADGCEYYYSNRNTDFTDEQEYYCTDSELRSRGRFHDFYCNGACSDHTSWVDDRLVEDCDDYDGWYDTGNTKWILVGQCSEKEQKEQEYRDYTCYENLEVECDYTVTDNQWVDTGKTRYKDLSTPCQADENLCTIDHCDGAGSCVTFDNVDCSGLDDQCQEGVCNPSDGECYPNYDKYPFSTPCEADSDKCTIDHCDGEGSCVFLENVYVPPAEDCKEFYCDPADGVVKENYSDFPLSTPCPSDDACKLNHCDGSGECVFWEDVPEPTKPIKVIGDPKIECQVGEWCEWKITTLTPITLTCEEGKVWWRYALDGDWNDWNEDGSTVTVYFPEESNHTLEAYCLNECDESEHDIEKFKVEGKPFEIPLYKKWNLISVPFVLLDGSVSEVFKNISDSILSVWTYDNGVWYSWVPGLGGTLTEIKPGWGYWVLAKEDTELLISGSLLSPVTTPPSKDLQEGWNLIGYYGTEWQTYELETDGECGYVNYNYGNYVYCSLNSLIDTVQGFPRWSSLWGYDNCGDDFAYWHTLEPCFEGFWRDIKMYAGKGYWIEMDVEDGYAPATNCIWNENLHCSFPAL